MAFNFKALSIVAALLVATLPAKAIDTFAGGGIAKGMPAVVAPGKGGILMFVRGSDDALWWRRGDGNGAGWTKFQSLGGVLASAPSCVSYKGAANCFVRGSDDALWTIIVEKDGQTNGWMSLDGEITNQPGSATGTTDGETQSLYAFARGTDGGLWIRERGYDAQTELYPWKDWRASNFSGFASPACANSKLTGVNCFVRMPDSSVRVLVGANYAGGEMGSLGGQTPSPPAAVSSVGGDVVRVFVRGTDDQLWMNTSKKGKWGGFVPMGATIHSGPSCAWELDGDIWCGALEANGSLTMLRITKADYTGK